MDKRAERQKELEIKKLELEKKRFFFKKQEMDKEAEWLNSSKPIVEQNCALVEKTRFWRVELWIEAKRALEVKQVKVRKAGACSQRAS